MTALLPLTIVYNGSCPVCRREILHYADQAPAAAGLAWLDAAADPAAAAALGVSGDDAFRRLHAVGPDGRGLAGIAAFIVLWERLPKWRWLARLVRRPGVRSVAEVVYERVLAPLLFAWHRRREGRRGAVR